MSASCLLAPCCTAIAACQHNLLLLSVYTELGVQQSADVNKPAYALLSCSALDFFGGPLWMSFICFAWGVVAASFAGIKNQATFLALRFLLGIFEAGAFPGMVFYVSTLYPRNRTQVPMTAIVMGILVSQCVGAAMAAGFLSMDGIHGMRGWQWLFLIEGLMCVLVSMYWVFVMPRSIETMKVSA
jgi:MFS family permease